MAEDAPLCGQSFQDLIYAEKWEAKEICVDPFAVICKYSDTHEQRINRVEQKFNQIKQKALDSIYKKYQKTFADMGIEKLTLENYQQVSTSGNPQCIGSTDCQSETQIEPALDIDMFIKNISEIQFAREASLLVDSKIDLFNQAYDLIKKRMVKIAKRELKDRLSTEDFNQQIEMLEGTIGLFSNSDESLAKAFPGLNKERRSLIKKDFDRSCFKKMKEKTNLFFQTYYFDSLEFHVVTTCPTIALASLEGAETLGPIHSNLFFGISHELGHQISSEIFDPSLFNKFNQCLKETIPPSDLKNPHEKYENEAQADFWAKLSVNDLLADMDELPIEERIHLLKETFVVMCKGKDDGIHHSTTTRLNKIFNQTPEFFKAFNCNQMSKNLANITETNDCNLDGKRK